MFKIFNFLLELFGWLKIVASPLLISLIIGGIIYLPNPTQLNLIIAMAVIILGLLIGILWANKIWKTKGTISFLSQISATPDLDNLANKKEDK
jgi:hypothetical protein